MGQVGENQEPLQEAALYAWDGDDWIKVKVDENGNLYINVQDLEVIQSRSYGWVGADWQKNPLQIGYSGQIIDDVTDLNADAGFNIVDGNVVPAGEIWVITQISIFNLTSATTLHFIALIGSAGTLRVERNSGGAAALLTTVQGYWLLVKDDFLRASFDGCTAGDDLHLQYAGWRIDIDQ